MATKKWEIEQLPAMNEASFLELTTRERRDLAGDPPTKNQLDFMFQSRAFRYMMARVKQMANGTTNDLVSGVAIPEGLREASNREAYFIGLVNGDRAVLHLQRELWEKALEREGPEEQDSPEEHPVEPEERFGSTGDSTP